ncbi:uncharacterized protein EI90DRAFT_3025478 [Cantharellus anzutake]|uniref:uncharacterized protein n=1 Tax=Cantharellus anzutake TaxID=1750568 RepID=UPI0019043134|nr:uncharacterized protein EI90DRAFT_3025478 [Cantharellus anzutake]KAF8309062.1 hypothetical protein EI90DRAFT_3025478 [Cantharellus anzutake]
MPIANSIEERWPLLPSILPSCLVQPESIPDNGPPPHVPVMDKSPSIPLWCFEPAPPPYSRSSPIPAAIPIDESPTNDAPSHLPSVPLSCLIAPNVPPSKEPSMGSNMGSEGVEPRRSSSPERLLGIPYLEGARLLPFEDNTANRDDRLPSIPACCLIAPQADSLMGVCSDVVNDPVLLGWEVGTGFSEQVSPTPSTMLDALRGSNAHEVLSRFHRGCILCLYQTGREVHHASQLSVAPISRPCPFYSLGTPYEVFKQGLHGATPSCVAFHRTVVSEQTYSYCGCCYIDKCRCHPPHHTFCHADESCPGIDDLDEREWYQRLLYLAFRQCWVRDRVAPHFGHSCESPGLGMDNKTVGEWGRWAAHVSAEGMRRSTIVAALACQELHLTSS